MDERPQCQGGTDTHKSLCGDHDEIATGGLFRRVRRQVSLPLHVRIPCWLPAATLRASFELATPPELASRAGLQELARPGPDLARDSCPRELPASWRRG